MKPILVVDDSPTIRRMVKAALAELASAGFVEAGSGLEAIERLTLTPVALMVLDLNMPDMHGVEVLEVRAPASDLPEAAGDRAHDARRRREPPGGARRRRDALPDQAIHARRRWPSKRAALIGAAAHASEGTRRVDS